MPNTFDGGIGIKDMYNSPVTIPHVSTDSELQNPHKTASHPPAPGPHTSHDGEVRHTSDVQYGDKDAGEPGLHDHNLERDPHLHRALHAEPNENSGPPEKSHTSLGDKIKDKIDSLKGKH